MMVFFFISLVVETNGVSSIQKEESMDNDPELVVNIKAYPYSSNDTGTKDYLLKMNGEIFSPETIDVRNFNLYK